MARVYRRYKRETSGQRWQQLRNTKKKGTREHQKRRENKPKTKGSRERNRKDKKKEKESFRGILNIVDDI